LGPMVDGASLLCVSGDGTLKASLSGMGSLSLMDSNGGELYNCDLGKKCKKAQKIEFSHTKYELHIYITRSQMYIFDLHSKSLRKIDKKTIFETQAQRVSVFPKYLHQDPYRYRVHAPCNHNRPRVAAIKEALDSLTHLQNVIDHAFGKVSSRIKSIKNSVEQIVKRTDVCKQRIEMVSKNHDRATTCFSFAKYPCSHVRDVRFVFQKEGTEVLGIGQVEPHMTEDDRCNQGSRCNTTALYLGLTKASKNKNSAKNARSKRRQEVQFEQEGLGKLPEFLPSVSSMLLFNSSENPYRKYSTIDNLVSSLLAKERRREKTDDNSLADAPVNLRMPLEWRLDGSKEDLKFKPKIDESELPAFDFEELPLPNIATDLVLDMTYANQQSIAPSNNILDELPVDLSGYNSGPRRVDPRKAEPTLEDLVAEANLNAPNQNLQIEDIPLPAPAPIESGSNDPQALKPIPAAPPLDLLQPENVPPPHQTCQFRNHPRNYLHLPHWNLQKHQNPSQHPSLHRLVGAGMTS